MQLSDKTDVSLSMKNMIGILVAVAMGVFAYTEVTARLTSLETSRELFQADLLKKSEQKPTDQAISGSGEFKPYGKAKQGLNDETKKKSETKE